MRTFFSMILEERVIFTDKEDAEEFVSYLRKRGCPCQKVVQAIPGLQDHISGTLDQAIALLSAETSRCEVQEREREATDFREAEDYYRGLMAKAEEILAEKSPGDLIVPRGDNPAELLNFLIEPHGRTGENTVERPSPDLNDSLLRPIAFGLLLENRVIVEKEEGWVLGVVVGTGDLRVQVEADTLPPIEPDALLGMTREIIWDFQEVHVVVADPLVHIVCDPEELLEFLDDLSVPDEVFDALEDTLIGKDLLVSRLLEEVEQQRGITVSALTERLNGKEVEVPGFPAPAKIRADEEMVGAVVAELRKRDVLAGTDQKVMMAGGKKLRK